MTQRGESKAESHQSPHKAAEAPHGVHNAVHHAYGKEATATTHAANNTSHGKVPEASFHKDHEGKEFINFAPPAEKTRGVTAPEVKPKSDAKPAEQSAPKSDSKAEQEKYRLQGAVSNFTNSLDSRYNQGSAPIEQSKVDELAEATKGMDPNQVSKAMQEGMPNHIVSKPDQNGNINVDFKPVVDRGKDTRAFELNTEKGEGFVVNSHPDNNYYKK